MAKRVAKTPNKRGVSEISNVGIPKGSSSELKKGIGKTGVHLRWHSNKSFKQLTEDQKKELLEWRANNKGNITNDFGGGNKKKKTRKGRIAAAVEKQLEKRLAVKEKESIDKRVNDDEARAYIMGLLNLGGSSNSGKVNSNNPSQISASQTGPKVTLQGILKNAKNRN